MSLCAYLCNAIYRRLRLSLYSMCVCMNIMYYDNLYNEHDNLHIEYIMCNGNLCNEYINMIIYIMNICM